MVQLMVNGENRAVVAATLAALLEQLGVDSTQAAVERNQSIVPKSRYNLEALAEGDIIEIVEFIGGG